LLLHSLFFINIDFAKLFTSNSDEQAKEIEVTIHEEVEEIKSKPESPYIEQITETFIPKETKNLRTKHISSKTKEYVYRSYYEVWQKKVERMGTMYYPKASAVKASSSNLITQVTVNSDGSIADITILRSSGSKELDQAASDIVRRGANYAEFSEQMKQEVDQVTITRVWKFI